MSDSLKYNLGEMREEFPRWEDIPAETRTEITRAVVSRVQEFMASLDPVIESMWANVLRPVQVHLEHIAPFVESMGRLADFLRRWVPNWTDGLDVEKAWEITGTGIPLAFVPRAGIVHELVGAADHESRLAILLKSRAEIVEDCRDAIQADETEPWPESIAMLPALLSEVVDVLEEGMYAAARALGVAIIDSAFRRTLPRFKSYPKVRADAKKSGLEESVAQNAFRISLALGPIHSLFEDWHPGDGTQLVPEMPSRHVVAHWAQPEHMTEINAIIIAMVATSLFLGLAERETIAQLTTVCSM